VRISPGVAAPGKIPGKKISANHVLKQVVQWCPNQLPELINKINNVDGQFADANGALCGRGDFSLQPHWANHHLTVNVWSKMTLIRHEKASKKCFRLTG